MRIGITDFAQDALGDVVFVELPEVGATVAANASFSEIDVGVSRATRQGRGKALCSDAEEFYGVSRQSHAERQ